MPAGFPREHLRARLLRHKILYVYKNIGLQSWLGSATAHKHVVRVLTDPEPVNGWLKRNVG